MLHGAILLVFLLASAFPGMGLAQTSSGFNVPETAVRGRQAPWPPGFQHNVGTLAEMMRDLHQILHLGPLTPKEAGEISDIMTRLGVMMKEMSGPQAEKYQSQHQRQLREMQAQLAEIKSRLGSRRK